jgi:hypothetical protein
MYHSPPGRFRYVSISAKQSGQSCEITASMTCAGGGVGGRPRGRPFTMPRCYDEGDSFGRGSGRDGALVRGAVLVPGVSSGQPVDVVAQLVVDDVAAPPDLNHPDSPAGG